MVDIKNIQSPSQSIQKSYLRQPVAHDKLENFRKRLSVLLQELNPNHREGANKGRVKTFLENTLWPSKSYEVNEAVNSNADLVIKDKELNQNVVMFEFKKVGSNDMVTKENMVRKSMFELVLYYIIEEFNNKNTNLKHLIISDGYQYFIFDKGLFWSLFGCDKRFVNSILSSERTEGEKRDYIYNQIIKPKIESVEKKLTFTYVDLKAFNEEMCFSGKFFKPRFKALYKLFSPIHLQNLPFSEDHNTLNKKFYKELLYIMGVEERGDKHHIQPLKEGEQQEYSLFEQVYAMLADYEVSEDDNKDVIGNNRFDTALGLVIVWVNRMLFMKLLESQLIAFNSDKDRYSFFDKLRDFAMMHYLFCKVMGTPENERSTEMRNRFGGVPYLNSTLFELAEIEKKYFPISSVRNGEIEIMKGTCLKNNNGKTSTGKIQLLDYLKRFLDSYDFGADLGQSGKTIINAAVLGLIFEKINGYKDGSFFTPGYITSYTCHETLRRCVLDKYNQKYGTAYGTFNELVDDFDYMDRQKRREVNNMINTLRICDPAVGSGHFIVSALNEIIAIKRELNVLETRDGKRFKYRVKIEDDELVVMDADGELRYNPCDPESQLVQETLFEEKRIIIENCLFGVDINPNSVEICQLRLWIELLKNAYYIQGQNGKIHLKTLPNIDINIKCGNSLVMKYDMDSSIDQILRGSDVTVEEYKKNVEDYKNSPSKGNKRIIQKDIENVKKSLEKGYDKETAEYKKWVNLCGEILKRDNSLFPPEEEETKKMNELRRQEAKLRRELVGVSSRFSRLKAFEWRYEFPEVLNDKGAFDGFDCIIGNPPYGVSISGEYRKTVEKKHGHVPDYEIYYYFICLGRELLKKNGYLAYIIPNTWMFNQYAQSFRESMFQINETGAFVWNMDELLDCTNIQIFESATVRNTVVLMQKTDVPNKRIYYKNTRPLIENRHTNGNDGRVLFGKLVNQELLEINLKDIKKEFSQNWGLAFFLTEEENRVIRNIEENTESLETYFPEISQGIIAYDKIKGVSKEDIEARVFHSETLREGFKRWLRGFDVSQYKVTWNSLPVKMSGKQTDKEVYVDYDNIPRARERKYFIGRRLLVREITNPSIFSAITEEELYHDPSILVVKDSEKYPLELVCAILNSSLSSFYHFRHSPKATKGAFPKIMISDLRNFPLPVISKENEMIVQKLRDLVGTMESEVSQYTLDEEMKEKLKTEIDKYVFQLYGLEETDISIIDKIS